MKFDKLRLTGFKSFVDPTDIEITPGLTGVVGPNGCGKSNLVEALRWVMGEASYKSVRGSSMDDVIFAGSGRRPRRDTAEVTLFLDNSARTAPADLNNADALEVTRAITRSLGSDYSVNGKTVRARDVQLLFADAATGSRSPSMVRQGQVAELIAAKPTDRRNILEEAAGISGLRARRHEATLKLNAAEQNLSRVDDVAGEVERQVEALKKQARQARRYKTISAEIRTLEATVHHLRWVEARAAVSHNESALNEARSVLATRAAEQTRTATEQAAAAHKLPPLRDAEVAAATAKQKVVAALTALDVRDKELAERLAALTKMCADLASDLERQDGAKADAIAAVARLSKEEAELKKANEGSEAKVAHLDAEAKIAAAQSEAADADANAATEKAAAATAARKAAEASAERLTQAARQAATERDRLREALACARQDDTVRRAQEATERLAEADTKESEASAALAAAGASLSDLKAADAAAREAAQRTKNAITERATEAKTLERLTATPSGKAGVLDECRAEEGFETALAVALGDDLAAPVSDDAPLRWTLNEGEDAPLPGSAVPLSTHVAAPPALARRLAQVGVVALDEGPALQQTLSCGQRLVSPCGALWRWDGFCRDAGTPSAAAERLAQKNRLAALTAELADLMAEHEAHRAAAEAAEATLREAIAKEKALQSAQQEARRAAADARQTLSSLEAKARQAQGEENRLAASLEAAEARAEATAKESADADVERQQVSTGAEEAEARDRLLAAARQKRQAAEAARNAAEAERRTAYGRSRRLERLAAELQDWRGRLGGADGHHADLAARLEEATKERDTLAEAPSETIIERRRLNAEAEAADAAEQAARDARVSAENAERAADKDARAALAALSEARENAARIEERLDAARTRLATVERDLVDLLDVRPEEAHRLAELDLSAPMPDRAESEARLDKLKVERERLGGVNLCAEDELAEIEERRGTMLAERDDLLAAIETLRVGIRELNKEARERLLASFDTVNAQFQRLFTHLFNGGEASLQLTEAEDPLDAGLDILARPPGKKPQVLSLLSGGEQTLTATALIFAVFLTNPAPICVLDEIDAPLDDANVERFCALLDEMTRVTDTRFMIITHNPITMARMHRLYGVTMVEKGVSQLVSVNLEAAEELRESA
ncbi:MAG: chromosome segregation protein SMC [Devosia sp.]